MADGIFNIAKGRIATLSALPAANDGLVLVLLQAAGLEADDALNNHDNLSVLLAATNDEATFTGYARRALGSVTVVVDDTNNRVDIDAADPASWTNTGAGQAIAKAVICYDPDTTTGTDADLVPLSHHDCVVTFDTGVAVTVQFAAAGIMRAS
ncbi:MAG: hypothetical protein ACRCSN_02600 [Dermatophilaceae bacterium]